MFDKNVVEALKKIVGDEYVLTDKGDLLTYSYDGTPDQPQVMPEVVVLPETTEEIIEIVKLAKAEDFHIYTRGSGTNLSGGTIPLRKGVVLVTTRMNKILEVDPENLTATVQPGVIINQLNEAVSPYGLIYPPDPGTVKTATMGGSVSESSGGLRGLKYGVTKDYVIGVEMVLANGELVTFGGKSVKNVAGYDLTKLVCGAEGTLGIITKILVKLIAKPQYVKTMTATFNVLKDAGYAINGIISNKVIPATMELLDQATLKVVEDFTHIGLPIEAKVMLLIEVDGMVEAEVELEAQKVVEQCKKNGCQDVKLAKDDKERDELMAARRAALPALARVKPTTVLEDATVPRSRIPDMLVRLEELAEKYDLQIGTFGHAGDGNLHPTILTDARDEEEMKRVRMCVDDIFAAALEMGGTLSGEHGIGIAKARFMEDQFGAAGMEVIRRVKEAFDPNYMFNPDHFFFKGE
ncbi:MAG: FAD-linked oxidase C-terminal domain-containing protein [Peptococcaceae bacterium]|jgi:glycolate oxidase|nr:FAD-linked oxidase C-terminal domain-containing protein [Peptococcaceae bacterium]